MYSRSYSSGRRPHEYMPNTEPNTHGYIWLSRATNPIFVFDEYGFEYISNTVNTTLNTPPLNT